MERRLARVTTPQLSAIRETDPALRMGVIIPVGAVEQHGAFLPVTCDTDIAIGAADALAEQLSANLRYRAWVAPAVPYGPVPGAALPAGTSSVGFAELGAYLSAVVGGFAATGTWDFAVLVNAHAHNHGRVIEASSVTYGQHRVPVLVLHVYDYQRVCDGLDVTPGSHGGEFEIALHRHYTGIEPHDAVVSTLELPRPRPASVFGLDLLPRSFEGIVAPAVPSVARAVAASDHIGQRMDAALAARALADLDTYFEHWHAHRDEPERSR